MNRTDFQQRINQPNEIDLWGEANLDEISLNALFFLKKTLGSWQDVSNVINDGDYLWQYLNQLSEDQVEEFFQISAIAHGCPVAVDIYENPSRNKIETIWSYLTKNRIYRGVRKAIKKSGKNSLLNEWSGEEAKKSAETGTKKIIRPEIDDAQIDLQGIEKVEVYWICQTLKNIEALKLGVGKRIFGINDDEINNLNILTYELQKNFDKVISISNTVDELCVNSFLEIVSRLREAGFDDVRIKILMLKGYDPKGPLGEHGQFMKIRNLWLRILKELLYSDVNHDWVIEMDRAWKDQYVTAIKEN